MVFFGFMWSPCARSGRAPGFRTPLPYGRGSMSAGLRSTLEVEAVQVHHLGPGGDEVFDELLLRVRAGIDFGESAQLRVRPEDQVDAGSGPLGGIGLAVAALIHA